MDADERAKSLERETKRIVEAKERANKVLGPIEEVR